MRAERARDSRQDRARQRAGRRPPSSSRGELDAVRRRIQGHPGGGVGVRVPLTPGLLAWAVAARRGEELEDAGGAMPPPTADDKGSKERKIDGKLFVDESGLPCEEDREGCIDANDVVQGGISDCYLVAALAAVADARPGLIQRMVRDNGDGTYTVTLYEYPDRRGDPTRRRVTVDSRFWVYGSGRPRYAKFGDRIAPGEAGGRPDIREIWPMVIEKAYAQMHGGYGEIEYPSTQPAWRELTGRRAVYVPLPSGATNEELRERIARHVASCEPVTFTSLGHDHDKKLLLSGPGGGRVRGNHAYALRAYHEDDGTVDLYNPHGKDHLERKSMAFIRRYFRHVRFIDLPGGCPSE